MTRSRKAPEPAQQSVPGGGSYVRDPDTGALTRVAGTERSEGAPPEEDAAAVADETAPAAADEQKES